MTHMYVMYVCTYASTHSNGPTIAPRNPPFLDVTRIQILPVFVIEIHGFYCAVLLVGIVWMVTAVKCGAAVVLLGRLGVRRCGRARHHEAVHDEEDVACEEAQRRRDAFEVPHLFLFLPARPTG